MEQNQNSTLFKVSKIFSDFFNPLVSLIIFFIYFSVRSLTAKESWSVFLPALLIIIVPVVIWLIWNVKTGRYTNLDVSDRKQRKTLYIFIEVCIFIYLLYAHFVQHHVDLRMLFVLILLVLMQLSNFFIKSSMHTAFNILVAAFFFAENEYAGIIWLIIAILVGITRVIVGRHTPKEVLMGSIIAFLVSFAYIYCQLQIQIAR